MGRETTRWLLERAKQSASSSIVILNNGICSEALKDFERSVQDSVVAYLAFVGIITKEKARSYLDGGYDLEAISKDTRLVSDLYAKYSEYLSKEEFDLERIMGLIDLHTQEAASTAQTLKILQRTLENPLEIRPLIIAFSPVKQVNQEDQERIASIFKYDREKGRSCLKRSRTLPCLFVTASVLFTYRLRFSEYDPIPDGLVQSLPELLKEFNRGIVGFEALLGLEYEISLWNHIQDWGNRPQNHQVSTSTDIDGNIGESGDNNQS